MDNLVFQYVGDYYRYSFEFSNYYSVESFSIGVNKEYAIPLIKLE